MAASTVQNPLITNTAHMAANTVAKARTTPIQAMRQRCTTTAKSALLQSTPMVAQTELTLIS